MTDFFWETLIDVAKTNIKNPRSRISRKDKFEKTLVKQGVSIGANADAVNDFLEKNYKKDMSLNDAASLAVAAIYISSETKEGIEHIKMSRVSGENGVFEFITNEEIKKLAADAKTKYPVDGK